MNIQFQANAELVYQFLDSNANMYFQCQNDQNQKPVNTTKGAAFGFFEFQDPVSYRKQFEQQGFESMIIFENVGATVQNMGNVLMATVIVMLLLFLVHLTGL